MLRFNPITHRTKSRFTKHFNTSYVAVQLLSNVLRILILLHFNTSYVAVQRNRRRERKNRADISIHLMLRFNGKRLIL